MKPTFKVRTKFVDDKLLDEAGIKLQCRDKIVKDIIRDGITTYMQVYTITDIHGIPKALIDVADINIISTIKSNHDAHVDFKKFNPNRLQISKPDEVIRISVGTKLLYIEYNNIKEEELIMKIHDISNHTMYKFYKIDDLTFHIKKTITTAMAEISELIVLKDDEVTVLK